MFNLTIHIYTLNSLILSAQKSFKNNEAILVFIKELSAQDNAIIKSNTFHTRIIKFNHEGKDYSFYF